MKNGHRQKLDMLVLTEKVMKGGSLEYLSVTTLTTDSSAEERHAENCLDHERKQNPTIENMLLTLLTNGGHRLLHSEEYE